MSQDEQDAPSTSLLFDVYALNQAIRRLLAVDMADSPLTAEEYAFYSAIFELESATPSALAARLGMPLTTVMDWLARLEGRGHVHRMTDPRDRRATRVVLTASGLRAHRGANQRFERAYARMVGSLGVKQPAVKAALSALREAVEEAARAAPRAQLPSARRRAGAAPRPARTRV